MRRFSLLSLGVAALMVLSACAGSGGSLSSSSTTGASSPSASQIDPKAFSNPSSEAKPQPSTSPTARSQVLWGDYDKGLQSEIDLATTSRDCRGIKSFFGMTTATESSVRARTGHGNDALIAYLNEALSISGCA